MGVFLRLLPTIWSVVSQLISTAGAVHSVVSTAQAEGRDVTADDVAHLTSHADSIVASAGSLALAINSAVSGAPAKTS